MIREILGCSEVYQIRTKYCQISGSYQVMILWSGPILVRLTLTIQKLILKAIPKADTAMLLCHISNTLFYLVVSLQKVIFSMICGFTTSSQVRSFVHLNLNLDSWRNVKHQLEWPEGIARYQAEIIQDEGILFILGGRTQSGINKSIWKCNLETLIDQELKLDLNSTSIFSKIEAPSELHRYGHSSAQIIGG